MTHSRLPRLVGPLLVALLACGSGAGLFARQAPGDALYQEGRRLFDALDYENAVKALDQAIAAIETARPADTATRERLASAYERRARSKFGLGNPDGAKADFAALVGVSPGYALTGQVSPRVVALFDEVVAERVTSVTLSVTPATAKITLGGVPIASGTVKVPVGDHELTVEQRGYRSVKQTIAAKAGETSKVTIALDRVSAVLHILTSPPDVEVTIDGVKAGRTAAGPAAADYADAIGRSGMPAASVSAALVVADIPPGAHTIEFSRDCSMRVSNPISIDKPDDIVVGPVALPPAVASLSVQANTPGAQVFIDGTERGVAPFTTAELCAGDHLIELRSRFGRDAKRVTARPGDKITVDSVLKPAFTLVSTSSEAGAPEADMRSMVERAFAGARTVTVLAAPPADSDTALKAMQLPAGWLAVDPEGRLLGAAVQFTPPVRSEASTRLAATFGAQGIATITMLERNRLTLALLAAGSAMPDVLDVRLDRPESIAAAIARLDSLPALAQPALGIVAIDVADVAGAAVVGVNASGPAAAKVQVGDIVIGAGAQPVADAAALAKLVAAQAPGTPLSLELRDAKGVTRRADVEVFLAPRLIGLTDQTLLVNRVLVDLRARLAASTDPFEQSVIRLNTAVALARVGDWNAARGLLKQVELGDRPGVGNGTVQYLLGVAAMELGNPAEAEAAFKAAAASDNLLTEDGPPVKELAEIRLVQLHKPGR
jgi:hypothetical protein